VVSRRSDADRFVEAVVRHHPDPFRSIARDAFEREADGAATARTRAEAVCSLMRLGASLGARNGHTGIHPRADHAEPLRFYPVRPYEFDDGVFVVSAASPDLVGAELVAIDGVAIESLLQEVEPLVPRDNDETVKFRRPGYLTSVEVLDGLSGVTRARRVFTVRTRDGALLEHACEPIDPPDTDPRLPRREGVRYLERRDERAWVERLDDGAIVVGYNVTRGETASLAEQIASLARTRPAHALVLDLRHNNGGDNTTYGPLLGELERLQETMRLVVLTSRVTFSAAMQLVVDLEQRTNATFVGEATGASPNHFGDATTVELPDSGLVARVATIWWNTAGDDDERLSRDPDVRVPLRSEDFFAGRDPVLDAALRNERDAS
jgi:hypothetical protein